MARLPEQSSEHFTRSSINAMKSCLAAAAANESGTSKFQDENGNVNLNERGLSAVPAVTNGDIGSSKGGPGTAGRGFSLEEAKGRNLGQLREAARTSRVEDGSGDRRKLFRKRSSSCMALKNAFSALYSADDFWRERIASGFFSVVYKVKHRTSGEVLVMKISQQTNTRANNLHEIELLNQLHHPNILGLKGVCIEEGQLHALTEFINGGSLQELICDDREYLSWPVKLKLSNDVAKGMKYLHSKGFMHRDLSSQNILVRRKNLDLECVIADLGLAVRIPKSENEVLPVVGTPYWISPECLHGKFYDSKSDVFSFGIIMCEIIVRVSADPEELPRRMDFGLNEAAFQFLAGDCPRSMFDVAIQCCKVSPKERPTFNSIVATLGELKHPHVANVSKSLSCTDAGFELQRSRSRTTARDVGGLLPSKKKEVTRSNSDSGSRALNVQRVSKKLNPFYDPREGRQQNDTELEIKNCEHSPDILSPIAKLCNDLTAVWPERKLKEETAWKGSLLEKSKWNSLPCIKQ